MSRKGSDDVADVACSTFIMRGRIARVIFFNYHYYYWTWLGDSLTPLPPSWTVPCHYFSGMGYADYLLITRDNGHGSRPIKTAYFLDVTE